MGPPGGLASSTDRSCNLSSPPGAGRGHLDNYWARTSLGRASFERDGVCPSSIGMDASRRYVQSPLPGAGHLKSRHLVQSPRPGEGQLYHNSTAIAPSHPEVPEAPPLEEFSLVVESINGNAWSSVKEWLPQCTAHVLLVQEHKLLAGDQVSRASQWCFSQGWKSVWAPCTLGEGGGPSSGVAILVRAWMGLIEPLCHGPIIWPHRAVAAVVQPPWGQSLFVSSLYLKDSVGMDDHNLEVLGALGAELSVLGLPFIVGGDFNNEPDVLRSTEFVSNLKAQLESTSGPTCFGTGGPTLYYYFVVSGGLAKAVRSASINDAGASFVPHVPVRVQFFALANLHVLSFRKPPPIAVDPPFGPSPQPLDYSKFFSLMDKARIRALRGGL